MSAAVLVFSILAPLENAVRWVLERFHYDVGVTWAWAIVGTTIVVRILLVPLTVRQIHSMQSLQRHAPEMKEIQRKYKGDRQKMNEEMMKFYKENHINPAASCLPLLAQAPVFISLYLVLKNFSKHVPPGSDLSWLYFVPNITAKVDSHWSGYVLLAVYALSQIFSTYFMSQAMDKTQRRLMMVLPLVFITVIAHFKVGLLIYWVTTNLWTVGQGLVTRRLVPRTAPAASTSTKKSSRTPPSNDGSGGNGAKTVEAPPAPPPKPRPASTQPRRVKRNRGGGRRR
ncbi:MAG TPA: YidC/Oxa1 family membrane protein insertase [Gaiellaceae bacterium]|nr:YidC/Oxa1 family membrane protein insertase [Gaiellaceae bacterium]